MGHAEHVTKIGCVGIKRPLGSDLQAVRTRAVTTASNLAERQAKLSEVNLKVQILGEKAGRSGDPEKSLDAMTKELQSALTDLRAKKAVLKEEGSDKGALEMELRAAPVRNGRREKIIYNFTKRLCTAYTTLMRAQASGYRNRLNAVPGDDQAREELLGGFRARLREDRHSWHPGNDKSDVEHGGRTSPPEGVGPPDNVVVVPPSTSPS